MAWNPTAAEMIAEMQRKPDQQLLLEWIERQDSIEDVRSAVSGYFTAVEDD